MKFRKHVELEHGLKQIDIAPLIDIIFLLLIFFMLTSSFIMQPGITIKLPKAVTSQTLGRGNLVITLTPEGKIYSNAEEIKPSEGLKSLLAGAAQENASVLIKADKRASLGKVVEIWDMAREHGIAVINIATDQ
ncbi:MAG: biopolymer transporter ExbD [Candidatus Omnitrophota bacterium]|jgi:biopolymer transport protein ExbD